MKEFDPMKAVYSYYFPESRDVISDLSLPEEIFLTQTPSESANQALERLHFKKGFRLPRNEHGNVDLDSMHESVIDAILEEYKDIIPGLSDFRYRYPTSGSSEGIFHYLSYLKNRGVNRIRVLSGEYEGYREYGKTLGIETEEFPDFEGVSTAGDFWFISNPSARNGNIIDEEEILSVAQRGANIALDLAYVGSTEEHVFDVSNPNIKSVFLSFSKPYGLFRFRIGFTFSRDEVPSLYANRWFKSIPALLIALKVAQEIGPKKLAEKYKPIQKQIVDDINRQTGLNMSPSDVLLLGNMTADDAGNLEDKSRELIEQFRRDRNYRFCLTPYFERKEKGGDENAQQGNRSFRS